MPSSSPRNYKSIPNLLDYFEGLSARMLLLSVLAL